MPRRHRSLIHSQRLHRGEQDAEPATAAPDVEVVPLRRDTQARRRHNGRVNFDRDARADLHNASGGVVGQAAALPEVSDSAPAGTHDGLRDRHARTRGTSSRSASIASVMFTG